ncbi:phosphonate ABC transporter substrate-binding protein [Sedimenticola selenatireducens]|uniref:Phosphonate ABC transporter substrate-binding protein n=1 Tax=Sedimenticola selenatireducens TaxID=191960 RepID=A0A557SKB8_9GAMM|nr:phosphonate ABC transporter substrate-binding protein [Sedimenticola selenatireducens]TVO77859.1 phosphonate ABC transporter substrate-binding protein [Sedimenticola selenatireducens]TVT65164.1 MAG: phosphonate ABC transporter substrate-binding protein [Sedimenticola selenatireducens]
MKLKTLFSKITAGLVLATSLSGISIAQADETKTINFGIISTESSQNLKTIWVPFLKDMSAKLGMEVKPFFASDYAGIIQGMRFDKVDVAWYGNKSAMEAVDRAGGEIFAQTVDVSGNPGYWSLLLANKSNDQINSVEDMLKQSSNLAFGNGDPNSTSGFLVPSYYVFAKNGVDPKKAFKRMTNTSHEANFLAVANGQVDVATNNTENLARVKVTHPEKLDKVKIIWKSPLIPSDPIVWRKNLPEHTKSKIYDFLMSYGKNGDAKEKQILADLGWAPFKPSNDDQLLPIRQLVLYKNRIKLMNNSNLSEADKAKQVKAIDDQLSELNRRMDSLSVASNN